MHDLSLALFGFPWLACAALIFGFGLSQPPFPPWVAGALALPPGLLTAFWTLPLAAHLRLGEIGAATVFLLLWSLAGYLAVLLQQRRLFDLVSLVIAGRLVIIYFQVFGSLVATGIGLIISGLVIMGAAWGWLRWRRRLQDIFLGRGTP